MFINRKRTPKGWAKMVALVLFDIFAVNIAFYLALLIRFNVNHTFHAAGTFYLAAFQQFAPWYTVCCVVIFYLFRLYSGIWRYAGINDVNRVIKANIITFIVQVLGTILFIRRMPLTYYAIGAVIQFVLIFISRFSYRPLKIELSRFQKHRRNIAVNVMIVGAGESAHQICKQFDRDKTNVACPVCVLDYRNETDGLWFDGIPVIGTIERMTDGINRYSVKSVIIADSLMPQEIRQRVRDICKDLGINVQDFSGYMTDQLDGLPFHRLLEYVIGPVTISLDGESGNYKNAEEAAMAFPGKYRVVSVQVEKDVLLVAIENDITVLNDINEAWVREYENAAGEEISFF